MRRSAPFGPRTLTATAAGGEDVHPTFTGKMSPEKEGASTNLECRGIQHSSKLYQLIELRQTTIGVGLIEKLLPAVEGQSGAPRNPEWAVCGLPNPLLFGSRDFDRRYWCLSV